MYRPPMSFKCMSHFSWTGQAWLKFVRVQLICMVTSLANSISVALVPENFSVITLNRNFA